MKAYYALADKTIKALVRRQIKRFERAKQAMMVADFDELTVIKQLNVLYAKLDSDNRQLMAELFGLRYAEALKALGQKKDVDDAIDEMAEMYVARLLTDPNGVTKYTYDAEVYRKRDRAAESVNATAGSAAKQLMLDKALRYWSQMSQQYVDETSDSATVQAYKAAGYKYVVWRTQEDEKVCTDCYPRDGAVYPIDAIPDKPHWRCRCWLEPVNKAVAKSEKDGKINNTKPWTKKLPNLYIGKSLGAKSKNYDIMDLQTGEHFHLVENTSLYDVEVFAGKGVHDPYGEAVKYATKYGGKPEDWQHVKGKGWVDCLDEYRLAELHWSQCEGYGKHEFFVKRWLDEG